jgi:uncharacterized membrane protein
MIAPEGDAPHARRPSPSVRQALRAYFVAGLLVIAPISVTVWVVLWVVQRLDNAILPHLLRAVGLEQAPRLPLVGAVFTVLVILLLGVIARHFFGIEAVRLVERALGRVPIARTIYAGVKQLLETVFQSTSHAGFRRVVLVEFPRQGLWSIGFTTGSASAYAGSLDSVGGPYVTCFVPKTPNPTTGFFLLVPEHELRSVDLTVEEAFKLIVSGGLVSPERFAAGSAGSTIEPAAAPEPVRLGGRTT